MKFTFEDYNLFCKDFNLKPSYYSSLAIYRGYINICDRIFNRIKNELIGR